MKKELRKVIEGMQNGNVEDIMCMKSMNDVNGVQERPVVDMTRIIRTAGEENTETHEANGEDDVLRPAK